MQTFEQSVFGWFEAELILPRSFELDQNTFTIVGGGAKIEALKSSGQWPCFSKDSRDFDTIYLDAAYEALFEFLTAIVNLEIGLGNCAQFGMSVQSAFIADNDMQARRMQTGTKRVGLTLALPRLGAILRVSYRWLWVRYEN